MFFRNLITYRLQAPWAMTAEQLAEHLSKKTFQPCGGLDRERRGWVPPVGNGSLVHSVNGQWLIALRSEKKRLPASAVKRAVSVRADEFEKTQGVRPGRRQLKEIKEQVIDDLLPRALTRGKNHLCVDRPRRGLVRGGRLQLLPGRGSHPHSAGCGE
jgi:DNA recombination-dependent growth factor C